jgi:dihydrofolate reductase
VRTTFVDMAMSLDGFIAGPNGGPGNPLGDGGTRLHQWVYELDSWLQRQGMGAGRVGEDDDLVKEIFGRTGAFVMGRRVFDEGEVGWPDPPPFRAPVFALTHHPREPWGRQGGTTFTFVTDGIERAIELALAAAGGKDVQVSGGASTVQQALAAGLVDELQLHLAHVLLGDRVRLFEGVDPERLRLEPTRVLGSDQVTHVRYRVSGG